MRGYSGESSYGTTSAKVTNVTLRDHADAHADPDSHAHDESTTSQVKPKHARKRWAVLQTGGARTYATCRDSFMRNIVHQTDPPMDVFTITFHHSDDNCHFDALGVDMLDRDSKSIMYDNVIVPKARNTMSSGYDRFARQPIDHWNLMETYQRENNVTYDYVVLTRPDMMYYSPLNVSLLEKMLVPQQQSAKENATKSLQYPLFSPDCCKFRGLCDRIAAASYQGMSAMMKNSAAWYKQAKEKRAEAAFKERALFSNMVPFDYSLNASAGSSFGFATMRYAHVASICQNETLEGKKDADNWPNTICLHKAAGSWPLVQNYNFGDARPSACALFNHSASCPDNLQLYKSSV